MVSLYQFDNDKYEVIFWGCKKF